MREEGIGGERSWGTGVCGVGVGGDVGGIGVGREGVRGVVKAWRGRRGRGGGKEERGVWGVEVGVGEGVGMEWIRGEGRRGRGGEERGGEEGGVG